MHTSSASALSTACPTLCTRGCTSGATQHFWSFHTCSRQPHFTALPRAAAAPSPWQATRAWALLPWKANELVPPTRPAPPRDAEQSCVL